MDDNRYSKRSIAKLIRELGSKEPEDWVPGVSEEACRSLDEDRVEFDRDALAYTDMILATVHGRDGGYAATVFFRRAEGSGEPKHDCSCGQSRCGHALVALHALHMWLLPDVAAPEEPPEPTAAKKADPVPHAREPQPAEAKKADPVPRRREPRPTAAKKADLVPHEREPLERWAAAQGVSDLLRQMPEALERELTAFSVQAKPWPRTEPFRAYTIVGLMHSPPRLSRANTAALRELVGRFLRERAESRQRWREALPGRVFGPATDRRLEPQRASLLAERARRLAAGACSRPEDEGAPLDVVLRPAPTELRFSPPHPSHLAFARMPVAIATFDHAGGVTVVGSPGHADASSAASAIGLEVVDRALAVLTTPHFAELATALADELAVPPWQHLLDALGDGFAEATAKAEAADKPLVGWRLKPRWGAPELTPLECTPKPRGGFKVVASAQYKWARLESADPHPGDALASASLYTLPYVGARGGPMVDAVLGATLDALAGHPRVFWRTSRDQHVRLERAELTLATRDTAGGFTVGFALGGRFWSTAEMALRTTGAGGGELWLFLDAERDRLLYFRVPPAIGRLLASLGEYAADLPADAARPFLEVALAARRAAVPIAVSPRLRGDSAVGDARPRLRLDLQGDVLAAAAVVQPAPELPTEVPGEGPEVLYVERDGALAVVQRDLPAEVREAEALWRALGQHAPAHHVVQLPLGDGALDLVAAAQAQPGLEVEWTRSGRATVAGRATAAGLSLIAKRGRVRDWFELGGEVKVEGAGAIPLGELLRAIRERQRYVRLSDGAWAEVDEALARGLRLIAKRDGKATATMAPVLASLEDGGATLAGAAELTAGLARLKAARDWVAPLPAGLEADLRPYQREGFAWLSRLAVWAPGACLADDMGLGKTVQALALLLARRAEGEALVVAPTSLGFNWAREAARFAPSLRVVPVRSAAEAAARLATVGPGDLVVTSYGVVAQNADAFARATWGTLVVDEAQWVKNAETQRARALHAIEARFVVALTGTPVENRPRELWSLMRLVAPGLLGPLAAFETDWARPVEAGDAEARAALAALISPFVLRRLKRDVAQDLPARTEITHEVVLGAAERARYDKIRAATLAMLAAEGSEAEAQRGFKALQALTRLRQLACHPGLLDPAWAGGSAKLEAAAELVGRLRDEGHRALVFSQFTGFLAKVRERLAADGVRLAYLDGQTPPSARQAAVDAFQAGGADVFLLSLKAGGIGLNLTAATYVIHLDPWWNPAVEDQATDRAHRIGQTQPVTVYRLVAQDTVEEGILRLHADKRELADALLSGSGSSAPLSYEEVLALLSGEALEHGVVDEDDPSTDPLAPEIDPDAARPRHEATAGEETGRGDAAPAPFVADVLAAATPTPPASGPVASAAATRLAERLSAALSAAVAAGELSMASADRYERAAERYLAFAAARGLAPRALGTLETYVRSVSSGTEPGGASAGKMARAAFGWLERVEA